jgi:hypothetical protein
MREMLSNLIIFVVGGLCGAATLFLSLANEMEQGPRVRWRSRRIFWRFFGDKSFELGRRMHFRLSSVVSFLEPVEGDT